jgi:cytochrome b561
VALLASYVVYSRYTTPHGGTVVGLVYGTIGLLAIVALMYYGVRKRSYRAPSGTLQAWLSVHVYLGVLTLVIIPLHAGFNFGWNVHTLAFVLMVMVVLSGLVGAVLYLLVPRRFTQYGAEVVYEGQDSIDNEFKKIVRQMRALCEEKSDTFARTCEEEIRRGLPTKHLGWGLIVGRGMASSPASSRQDLSTVLEHIPETERHDFQRLAVLVTQKRELERRLREQMRLQNLLEAWLYMHLPVSIVMVVAIVLHIAAVLYY